MPRHLRLAHSAGWRCGTFVLTNAGLLGMEARVFLTKLGVVALPGDKSARTRWPFKWLSNINEAKMMIFDRMFGCRFYEIE